MPLNSFQSKQNDFINLPITTIAGLSSPDILIVVLVVFIAVYNILITESISFLKYKKVPKYKLGALFLLKTMYLNQPHYC